MDSAILQALRAALDKEGALLEIIAPQVGGVEASDGSWIEAAQQLRGGPSVLYRVRVEEQETRSRIGSGDAFLAGYVASRYSGRATVECLRFGVACGAESTQHFGAGIINPSKVDRLLSEVEAERLDVSAQIG